MQMKVFTKWLLSFVLLCVAGVANAGDFVLGQELTTIADLEDETFVIVSKIDGKAIYGSGAQNLGFDPVATALASTTTVGWRIEEVDGGYLFRAITPSGDEYNIWGNPGYLNSQPASGGCCFILGINGGDGAYTYGQDLENGALWNLEYEAGKGFALKNVGTGFYMNSNDAAKYETPIYWSFYQLKEKETPTVGWTNVLTNGDLEGNETSSFAIAFNATKDADYYEDVVITPGAGVDGSRGLKFESMDNAPETWSTQFFVCVPEKLPEGTKWKIQFDARADRAATITTSAQGTPRDWHGGGITPDIQVTSDWDTYTYSGTLSADFAQNGGFGSMAFDLNQDKEESNTFYFDNFTFEIYKIGTTAQFEMDLIQLDFGYETNITDLVKATGKKRIIFPEGTITVKVGGKEVNIISVEGYEDGRFYIFVEDQIDETAEVVVSFKNPTAAAYQLKYTSGPDAGKVIEDYEGTAVHNADIYTDDAYPYTMATPTVIAAEPENGSFNLPNSIKEFKFKFDNKIDCKALVATLNKESLKVTPADGFAQEITLTRTGTGDLATGEYTLTMTKIYPEEMMDKSIFGEEVYTYYIGKKDADPTDVEKVIVETAAFDNCSNGGIPEGYLVNFNGEERTAGNSYSSGARLFDFSNGTDFKKGLYYREGFVEYGVVDGYELNLEAGKSYTISFNTAMWKSNGKYTNFQILNESEEILVEKLIENQCDVNGDQSYKVAGTTKTSVRFVPEESGKFFLKWIAADQDGNQAYSEVLLANPMVKYIPNVPGIEYINLLKAALDNAKAVLEANSDARYSGPAYDALDATIKKYEAESADYTAPSKYEAAAKALDEAAATMTKHHDLIATYDPLPAQGQEILDINAEKKFAKTDIYKNLEATVAKYSEKKTETIIDETTGETIEVDEVIVKELKDDDELQAAVDDLTKYINLANQMFTEGASKVGDWSSTRTGYAVLVDRIRQGVEVLKELGVAEDDPMIVEAENALADDESIANALKQRITGIVYKNLSTEEGYNEMFAEVIDEETLESSTTSYNMTVFVKNPNIYKQSDGNGYQEGAVPGWNVVSGRGFSTGWNEYGSAEVPVDCMFSNWGGSFTVYQTIEDLPAGLYKLQAAYGERMSEDEAADALDGTCFYAKTSDYAEDDSIYVEAPRIGQSFPEIGGNGTVEIEDVEVVDGFLTLGVQAGSNSHVFFNEVKILLTGSADGFDYAKAYEDYAAAIDVTEARPTKVRAIELYDLNGRRIHSARQGVAIVKKYMSDGTVRTEKVIKK